MSVAYPAACSFCGLAHHEGYFPKRTQVAAHAKRIRELEAELERRTIGLQQAVSDNLHAYERERARAERAEAALVEGVRESNKKYQARVKDLEAQLELLKEQKGIGDIKTELRLAVTRAEKLQAYNVDLKDRLETGSRWLKAEIAGRKKAEKDRDDWRRKFDALVAVAVVPEGTLVPFVQELSRKQEKNVGPKR